MRRFSLLAAVALCVAPLAGTLAAAAPASATTGESISGTVTDVSSTPISGICVQAFPSGSTTSSGSATAATDGTYSIAGLAAGSYDLEFSNGCGNTGTYVTQWYNDATSQSSATAVTVTSTTGATGVNASLVAGGAISGTVTDTSSNDVAGICVDAYATTAQNTLVASATTASDGTYSLSPLPAANYYVEFSDGCGDSGNYLTQWYNNAHTEAAGTAVSVTAGSTTPGINAAVVEGATISGTVTDTSSQGIAGICVEAFTSIGQTQSSGFTETGAGGAYSITGLATGSYYVSFTDGCGQSGTYATQWYLDATTEQNATAVSATAGLTTAGINAALTVATQLGSISGTVTDATSTAPLAGICVDAYGSGGFGSATTASDGTYTISGLPAGAYDVAFSDGCGAVTGYAEQWYAGANNQSSSTPVPVVATQTTTGIDAAMTQGGTISGTVTDTSSVPLQGVCVDASSASVTLGETQTASDGTYSIGNLVAGSYTVEFQACGAGSTYATQWYDDADTQLAATPVTVSAGTTTPGIDAALVQGGVISGKVTGPAGGGLKGICVSASPSNYGSGGYGYAVTAANGTYKISGLQSASYDVDFSTTNCSTAGNYVGQWYADASQESLATPVAVTTGQTTAAVNATLARGATITGTVTDASSIDLSGICVTATATNSSVYTTSETTTDAYGTYALTRLPAGSYDIEFTTGKACGNTGNYAAQWYQDASSQATAKQVTVTPGTTTSNINAALAAGGTISGTVTGAGTPLANICVNVIGPTNTETTTAANGTYTVAGLSSGTYQVEFSAGSYCGNAGGYVTQWYKGALGEATATPVSVTVGSVTANINAAMLLGGSISGTVSAKSATTIGGICVEALNGPAGYGYAQTSSNGTYTITGLAPGSYDVEFSSGCGTSNWLAQWYKNAATEYTATPVKVTGGVTTKGINAVMAPAGAISGKVTNKSGTALAGVCVALGAPNPYGTSTVTASNGTYTIPGVAPGSYNLSFYVGSQCGNTANYLTQYYKNAPSLQTATPVKVSSGTTTANINAALAAGGSITGTVTNGSSTDLSGICVSAGSQSATTASNGTYSIKGLATGTYQVAFAPSDCGSDNGYAEQWYNDASSLAGATPVSVTTGKATSGINAALLGSGSISGTVLGPSSAPLSGICVDAQPVSAGGYAPAVSTNSSGVYMITGLDPGTYDVDFYPSTYCGNGGNYLTQWYNGAATQAAATAVTVTAATTTPGINATLKAGGQITGTVKDSSAAPIAAICVEAYNGYAELASAQTAADGTYTLSGLATGSYDVEFVYCAGNAGTYLSQWYNGVPDLDLASPVSVTATKTTSGINATLATAASISGTVTNGSGTVLSGICVGLFTSGGSQVQETTTGVGGSYQFTRVPAGKYQVGYNVESAPYYCPSSYLAGWYKNAASQKTATVVTVTGGASVTGINGVLHLGGSISGTVTNAASGTAIVGICVDATSGGSTHTAVTSPNGSYTIEGLPAGSYQVEFVGPCNGSESGADLAPQWYNGASTSGAATLVSVTAGTTTKSINAAMTAGGTITGTVTNSSGHPQSGGCVSVTGSAGSGYVQTAADGTYTVSGLASGTYDVEFISDCSYYFAAYQTAWYGNVPTQQQSTAVSVTAGVTTSGINGSFAVLGSGSISGTVMDASSSPVAGICVYARPLGSYLESGSAVTASNGTYTLTGLVPGSYVVEFSGGCGSSIVYAPQWYSGTSIATSATPVVVTNASTTSSVNATMVAPGSIKGTVKNGTRGVAGECVAAYAHGTAQQSSSTATAANGTYTMSGLAPGSYDVEFFVNGYCGSAVADYAPQWYSGASSQGAATPVNVTAGTAINAVNANLTAGGSISGTVTLASQPDTGACVSAFQAGSSSPILSTQTNLEGGYRLTGLAAGSYTVQFGCEGGATAVQWYNGTATRGTASVVTVTAGSTTAGISATLVAGGSISGTVRNSGSAPMGGACVSAFDPGSTIVVAQAVTAADGTYTLTGLATSSYDVKFDPTCGGLTDDPGVQWYNGKTSQATANTVAVTAGSVTSGIGATLS